MLKDWTAFGIVLWTFSFLLSRIVLCPQEGNLLAYKHLGQGLWQRPSKIQDRQTYLEFRLRNGNCLENLLNPDITSWVSHVRACRSYPMEGFSHRLGLTRKRKRRAESPVLGGWPKMHCQRPAHARSLPTKEIVHGKCKRLGISLWIQFLQKQGEELKLLGSSSSSNSGKALLFQRPVVRHAEHSTQTNFRVVMGFLLALAELERVTCCLQPNQDKCLTSLTKSGCFSLASKVHLQKSPLFRTL